MVADNVSGGGVIDGRGANSFYVEQATTNDWVEVEFGFTSSNQKFINDTANAADISYSKGVVPEKHGEVRASQEIDFRHRYARSVFIKSTSAGSPATLRIHAW